MADELNTIKTTELLLLDTSLVIDILVNSSDDAGRITLENFLTLMNNSSDWYSITSKPFTDIDINYFVTTVSDEGFPVLSLKEDIITTLNNVTDISNIQNGMSIRLTTLENDSHTHENKEIIDLFSITEENKLMWNDAEVGYKLTPATSDTLGGVKVDGETITIDEDGTLHGANTYELPTASNTVLGGVKVDGTSIVIDANGIISANTQGLDFEALTTVLTTGTQSGIKITADSENERFNFEVIGIPTIDPSTKNWIVGTVDTGVKAEAQSNYFYTGTEFPTSDLIDGDLFLSFADDTRGNVYQYQDKTVDWSLQGNLYGGGAVIDDTSTNGNTVTWSANKINSMIGDINSVLASVTGGIE